MLMTAAAMVCSMAGCSGKDAGTAGKLRIRLLRCCGEHRPRQQKTGKTPSSLSWGPSSEPEAGFDPAYGWELENMSMSR